MKILQSFRAKIFLVFLIAFGYLSTVSAQSPATPAQSAPSKKDKEAAHLAQIKMLVDSQNYLFTAQRADPTSARTRILTGDYTLQVTKDAIYCYLPYFGRAYVAPVDPTRPELQFTATKFDYTVTPRKKGGWDIEIKPRDIQDVQRMLLDISEDGYTILRVYPISKSPISFNGTIDAPKPNKK